MLRALFVAPAWITLAGVIGWGAAALWFDGPASRPLAALAAVAFAGGCVVLLARVHPRRRGFGLVVLAFLALLAWWFRIPPRNDRDWAPDVARPVTADIHGDRVTIHDLRNFDYRSETDFTPHWEDRTYDLSKLTGLDLYLSYWGPTAIAHTILSWEFSEGPPLAISIETRREKGEDYSAVRGFVRHYELYYVVADERDVIRLRTNYRGEDVYLFRLRTPRARARAILLDYLAEANQLARQPKWNNALTDNCTTGIRVHSAHAGGTVPWSWKLVLNGHLDEFLHEHGVVNTSLPLAELKARSDVTPVGKAADQDADYSARLREGLPPRPPPPPGMSR